MATLNLAISYILSRDGHQMLRHAPLGQSLYKAEYSSSLSPRKSKEGPGFPSLHSYFIGVY